VRTASTARNRAILRFVPDERGNIVAMEGFLACSDPHFRPSHIVVDHDGSFACLRLVRPGTTKSDKTGRIWRIRYTGKDRPRVTHELDSARWNEDAYVLSALGSASHRNSRRRRWPCWLDRGRR